METNSIRVEIIVNSNASLFTYFYGLPRPYIPFVKQSSFHFDQ